MTLIKRTFDNSVRYVPKSEQTREYKQNTIKNNSVPQKKSKNISQINKKFHKNVAAQGFADLE